MAPDELEGGCHCGAIRVALNLTAEPGEAETRACACTFCRGHGARTVTDPEGHLAIRLADPEAISRYRFGPETADFLVCGRCGIYVAAVIETPSGPRATLNINALDRQGEFAANPPAADYEDESRDQRVRRRRMAWTPATIDEGAV